MADLNIPGGDDDREPFVAFLGDDKSASVISPIVEEYGWQKKRVQKGTIESATRALGVMDPPKLLVIDLGKSKKAVEEVQTLVDSCNGQTFIIAIGDTNDVKFYRELMAAGVMDYLLKPLTRDVMASAISRAFISVNEPEKAGRPGGASPNRMTTIIGVRGGVGASTVAINLGWIISHEFMRTTALLDLDIHFGTSALSFDLEPGRGLADALEDPTRIDELFIERAMIKVGERFSILGSEMPFEEPFSPDPRALVHLVGTLKNKMNYLVVDLPRGMAGEHPVLLEESDEIILVTELALAATRDTIRFLAFLKNIAPKAKVKVAVNCAHQAGAEEVSLKDFETSIETKIDYELPSEPKVVLNAVKQGKVLPQVGKDSRLVKVLRNIAHDITGIKTAPKQKKGTWLSRGK